MLRIGWRGRVTVFRVRLGDYFVGVIGRRGMAGVERITATHPGRRPDLRQPIGDGWDAAAAIFLDVLLGDIPDGNDAAV
jgi:hypothetical protein